MHKLLHTSRYVTVQEQHVYMAVVQISIGPMHADSLSSKCEIFQNCTFFQTALTCHVPATGQASLASVLTNKSSPSGHILPATLRYWYIDGISAWYCCYIHCMNR